MPKQPAAASGGTPRLRTANRQQVEFRASAWDDLLPADHQARIVWKYVEGLDLSPLRDEIKAVAGRPGHPVIDPRILMTLWLYATLRGVGSARELARRCEDDLPFQWICGGVSVNHHTLSDFRVARPEFLDQTLTRSIALLVQEELVTLDRVAQDGMKVRASAGAASFRRRETLETHLEEARQQVETLKQELDADPAAANRRQQAATAECVNAIARNRGLGQFRVRGQPKVWAVMLWYVLAHNLIRAAALRAAHAEHG